jgi:polyisoprenoid-binding protein YceI
LPAGVVVVFVVSDFLNSGDAKGEWLVVAGESAVTFENKTLWGMSTVSGRFTKFSGHGRITEAGDVSGELDVEASSVDSGSRRRDRHLRSDDFFKVARFPQIKVVVTGVDPVSAGAVDL